jgi:uncharacterized protein
VRENGAERGHGPPVADADGVLARLCTRHGIRRLSLFGSVLKGTVGPDSDVDLLVEFERDATPTLPDMAAIEDELSALLQERRVDLRTPQELSRCSRDDVAPEAEPRYVAGRDPLC